MGSLFWVIGIGAVVGVLLLGWRLFAGRRIGLHVFDAYPNQTICRGCGMTEEQGRHISKEQAQSPKRVQALP